MCTLAYCPDPTFIPECTRCIDGYTLLNKRCTSLSISPVQPIQMPRPIQIKPIPHALPPLPIKTFPIKPVQMPLPLPIKPCICAQIYAPVCCSDGQTYSNQCRASCNGLTSCKTGECPSITDPILPCKYVPICNYDPCELYYNYPTLQRRLPGNV